MDFNRLNDGGIRYCCTTTDIETGECVTFDTARNDRITADHVMASGSLVPAFPPAMIDGRLLADGGLIANAPLEPLLASDRRGENLPLIFLLDLFTIDGLPPQTLEKAAERAIDLKFSGQTQLHLTGLLRERALEARLDRSSDQIGTDLLCLNYRAPSEEAGPEKPYDFSRRSVHDRMDAGRRDAKTALSMLGGLMTAREPGLRAHRVIG